MSRSGESYVSVVTMQQVSSVSHRTMIATVFPTALMVAAVCLGISNLTAAHAATAPNQSHLTFPGHFAVHHVSSTTTAGSRSARSATDASTMPNLLGLSDGSASSHLVSAARIAPTNVRIQTLTAAETQASGAQVYPAGTVIAQIPAIGARITAGTQVILRVTP